MQSGGVYRLINPQLDRWINVGNPLVLDQNIRYQNALGQHDLGGYGGSVDGLRIVNNVISASAKIYGIDSALPASVVIDNNVVQRTGSGYLATVAGIGNFSSLAAFATGTGFDRHGVAADPQFVDVRGNDYRLAFTSPAVDAGMSLPGVTDDSTGAAPDAGYRERR